MRESDHSPTHTKTECFCNGDTNTNRVSLKPETMSQYEQNNPDYLYRCARFRAKNRNRPLLEQNHEAICNCDIELNVDHPLMKRQPTWWQNLSNISVNMVLFTLFVLMCLLQPIQCTRSSGSLDGFNPAFDVWDYRESLDPDGAFVVEWKPIEEKVIFRVTVRTKGYIGFGLSNVGRMDGADIVVGWVHSGKAYLQDRHGKGNNDPEVDDQQDWMLVWGFENDTHTVLIMTRPYNTCDPKDYVISNDTVSLLWAYHPDDPVDPESPRPRLHYHGSFRRGARSASLLQHPIQHDADFNQRKPIHTWTLQNPGVEMGNVSSASPLVPVSETLYWCKIFKRPHLVQKNHVIRYEPVFTEGSEPHIHHMILYECTPHADDEPAYEELSHLKGHPCYLNDMEQLLFTCNHVVVVWTVGSGGLSLPPAAGYPLTPNGPKFYMMETHYDVPQPLEAPFVDSSGLKVFYTPILRNYDAGVLSVGMDPTWKHLIPPRQARVLSQGHCVGECTETAIPPTGINVFAVILHTHLLGRKVQVRHIRKNKELEPIAQDNNYHFGYQEYRSLQRTRLILPGDHLIGECEYNSKERSTITLGGFKTRDEKCLSFLFYYPRMELSFCHSQPSLNTVLLSLGILELSRDSQPIKIKKPNELAGKTLEWRLQHYDWENQFEHFQEITRAGSLIQMCRRRGKSLLPKLDEIDLKQPNITEKWTTHNSCPERPPKKKTRRRKNKGRSRGNPSSPAHEDTYSHTHRQHHNLPVRDEDKTSDEEFFEDEFMVDDDMPNFKPIERIDVDPLQNYDVFLPIKNRDPLETLLNNQLDLPGVNNRRDSIEDERILQEEFAELERELEDEINRLPDNYQERTANNIVNIDTQSGQSGLKAGPITRTVMCISFCILLLLSVCT